jgi:hypothetical protein
MAAKKAKRMTATAAAVIHHRHLASTSKLSHMSRKAPMQPVDETATCHWRSRRF